MFLILLLLVPPPASAALQPGPGPFTQNYLAQPVPGAPRGAHPDDWKRGKLCRIGLPPYEAANGSNATAALQKAIDDCGDRTEGGTVLVPAPLTLTTASLWLRSNLTLRVEEGATLLGSPLRSDAPMT